MSEELDFDGSVIVELLLSFLKSDKVKYDSIGSKLGVMSVLDALGSDLDEGNYEATPEAYVVYKDFKDLLDEDDEEDEDEAELEDEDELEDEEEEAEV